MNISLKALAASLLLVACNSSNNELADLPAKQKVEAPKADTIPAEEENFNTFQNSFPT